MLESMGYDVVCKSNGRECIDFFQRETEANRYIEAMIFDLTVPGEMGGREAAQEIRNWNTQIPIFVTSGYTENAEMTNPPEYGFTDSIPKPFTTKEVVAMFAKHFVNTEP
jgi:CheY-like chemotaxis protein